MQTPSFLTRIFQSLEPVDQAFMPAGRRAMDEEEISCVGALEKLFIHEVNMPQFVPYMRGTGYTLGLGRLYLHDMMREIRSWQACAECRLSPNLRTLQKPGLDIIYACNVFNTPVYIVYRDGNKHTLLEGYKFIANGARTTRPKRPDPSVIPFPVQYGN